MDKTRRDFIRNTGTLVALGGLGFHAKSYARIIGANDRINVGIMGTNGRGASAGNYWAEQSGV